MAPTTPPAPVEPLTVRPARPDDRAAVLELATRALGWDRDAPNAEFFAWKHDENPAGSSPAWLALDGDRLVGVRTFLRWRFRTADGSTVRAVRAVDTATDPDYQRRGIFSSLTLTAVAALGDEGVGFVFNTPNDKSRPGYLKLGWETVGRLPLAVGPTSLGSVGALVRARVPAEKWSEPVDAGLDPGVALDDADAVGRLVDASSPAAGLATERSAAYLRWRYGFEPLHYRAFTLGSSIDRGLVVVRVRRRGAARELAIVELLVPGGDRRTRRALLREARRHVSHDYAVLVTRRAPPAGFLPAPRQGPVLTWRALTSTERPAPAQWALSLGDVELF